MRRFFLFISVFVSVLILCGYYLGNRILSGSPFFSSHPTVVWSGIVSFLLFVLMGPMLSRILPERFAGRFYAVRWSINMTMAIFFSVLFYTFAVDLTVFFGSYVFDATTVARLQSSSLSVIGILVVGTFAIGAVQALTPKIYRVDVPIDDLPKSFEGFKIAQISDLHIGEMIGHRYTQSVVQKTNALEPDAIALTGDIIDGKHSMIAPVAQDLAALKAKDGVYYVTGNHEYYWGIHHSLAEIHRAGLRILMNENVRIHRGSDEIAIAGVADISQGPGTGTGSGSDPVRAVANVPSEIVKVLLAHQPVSYRKVIETGVHLQLSGHTHGGQFFPWSLVVRLFQHYNKGLIAVPRADGRSKMWLYVNRGTATWGPRLRFGIPPEITLLTLRRA